MRTLGAVETCAEKMVRWAPAAPLLDDFQLDRGLAGLHEVELLGGAPGDVDDGRALRPQLVVDGDDHALSVRNVRHLHLGAVGELLVGGGEPVLVVGLAAGRLLALKAVAVEIGDALLRDRDPRHAEDDEDEGDHDAAIQRFHSGPFPSERVSRTVPRVISAEPRPRSVIFGGERTDHVAKATWGRVGATRTEETEPEREGQTQPPCADRRTRLDDP